MECPENLSKGSFFSFYLWDEEREKKFHFVSRHSDGAKGLLLAAALTADKKMYILVCRADTLSVCYICPGLLSFEDDQDCFLFERLRQHYTCTCTVYYGLGWDWQYLIACCTSFCGVSL